MPWQASFQSAEPSGDQFKLDIIYFDGTKREHGRDEFVSDLTDAAVEAVARKGIADREKRAAATLTYTANAIIQNTAPLPPPVIDQAQVTFLRNWRKLQGFQNAIDLGATTTANAAYVALKATVASQWLDAYAGVV